MFGRIEISSKCTKDAIGGGWICRLLMIVGAEKERLGYLESR